LSEVNFAPKADRFDLLPEVHMPRWSSSPFHPPNPACCSVEMRASNEAYIGGEATTSVRVMKP